MVSAELLVRFGFIKKSAKEFYKYDEVKKEFVKRDGTPINPKDADEETAEVGSVAVNEEYNKTGFPSSIKRYELKIDSFNQSVEAIYFWMLNHLRIDWGYPHIIKTNDVFSASENSAFFGQSAQRLSIQQDRAAQFLRGISELVKQLFQLVRELRIIDERLELYEQRMDREVDGKRIKGSKSADVTLKGLYIDLVEGGTKNPSSVYGLAQQVGFTILPDLFFNTLTYDQNGLDAKIDGLEYNKQVKNIVKRKLLAYIIWADKTHEEHLHRKRFQLQYLRQHWATIKMYMAWIKPYLKTIKRLTMNQEQMDSPDLVAAFETSLTEVEFLAYKKEMKGFAPVIMCTFEYRTKPTMSYRQEYQQGPLHMGEVSCVMRAYTWSHKTIDNYRRMKDREDFEMLGIADTQIQAAMESLGDELTKYLEQAELGIEAWERKVGLKKTQKKSSSSASYDWSSGLFAPVAGLFYGLGELFGPLIGFKGGGGNPFAGISTVFGAPKKIGDPSAAKGMVLFNLWQTYKNYKKGHGLLAW